MIKKRGQTWIGKKRGKDLLQSSEEMPKSEGKRRGGRAFMPLRLSKKKRSKTAGTRP